MPTVRSSKDIIILGGGLAGLAAGYVLSKARRNLVIFEADSSVGGLSKTISCGQFRFDLGGHRFIAKNQGTSDFVKDILKGNYLTVPRKSKIYMMNRFFDYPLKPANALFGLGMSTSVRAFSDYAYQKIMNLFRSQENISLEDWVINNFGRTMFALYFRDYSEKVWGIECRDISEEWVSKRIEGLSLGVAIKNAFFKYSGRDVDTLKDEFIYPAEGIGAISERLSEEIRQQNPVLTSMRVDEIHHEGFHLKRAAARNCSETLLLEGNEFISSIPLPSLVSMLKPAPPEDVLHAASLLRYRDLVVVTVMLDRQRVTDLTWIYLPEKDMPVGRLHEPRNWSPRMAPEGKTHLVAEYFCFQGDCIWNTDDERLSSLTVDQLVQLGLIRHHEVMGSCVVRVPKAYPVLDVGYQVHYSKILDYLMTFKNLHLAGRTGMFRYYNMDRAIECGIESAEEVLKKASRGSGTRDGADASLNATAVS